MIDTACVLMNYPPLVLSLREETSVWGCVSCSSEVPLVSVLLHF